ncbi:MAG: hypothetical protein MJZ30_05910 [Paludibacteraceae bacterium]|nr:hypothetical protein [Paludibacteraceae bacterium]
MKIELYDTDVPYELVTDTTEEGKAVVKICPQSCITDRFEDYDIVLDYDKCQELIRALQFISNEIKS